jgi:hypothetical protein
MTGQVECYAGSRYPEKPRVVIWEGHRYTVEAIYDQRREPDGIGFRVLCQPDRVVFDLFYYMDTDTWEIQLIGPSPTA